MKRVKWFVIFIVTLFVVLCLIKVSMAADITATLTWDGRDSAGNIEQSLPVTFTLYDAATDDVLATAQANGACADLALNPFTFNVPDNQTVTLSVYATARDSAGNASSHSNTASVVLTGSDTNGPIAPVINITITQ